MHAVGNLRSMELQNAEQLATSISHSLLRATVRQMYWISMSSVETKTSGGVSGGVSGGASGGTSVRGRSLIGSESVSGASGMATSRVAASTQQSVGRGPSLHAASNVNAEIRTTPRTYRGSALIMMQVCVLPGGESTTFRGDTPREIRDVAPKCSLRWLRFSRSGRRPSQGVGRSTGRRAGACGASTGLRLRVGATPVRRARENLAERVRRARRKRRSAHGSSRSESSCGLARETTRGLRVGVGATRARTSARTRRRYELYPAGYRSSSSRAKHQPGAPS